MANRITDGMTRLAARLKAEAASSVTYRRGPLSVSLTATMGSQLLRLSDGLGGMVIQRADRDFIITASDLVLNGDATEPRDGDIIDVSIGGNTERFMVSPIGTEASWRHSDAAGTIYRIHTKHVKRLP